MSTSFIFTQLLLPPNIVDLHLRASTDLVPADLDSSLMISVCIKHTYCPAAIGQLLNHHDLVIISQQPRVKTRGIAASGYARPPSADNFIYGLKPVELR